MKPCPTCHQLIPESALFCPNDGTSLTTVENDPLLGSVISERYLLQERVGEGRSGIIYRAEHVALRTRLALKLLHHPLSQNEAAVDRFREEATRLAQLDSEHIVRVNDFGRAADERLFFAMEFLEGESLASAIGRDGKLPETDAIEMLEQIGDAVADAHEIGIVHGDLRPRNIFLTRRKKRRVVKLLDFGLTKLSGNGAQPADKSAMSDPRYLAPEQASGAQPTEQSDIYALGIIAYEMLAGAPPFVGAGTFDVLTKHLEAKPVPLTTKAAVSERVAAAVDRALAKQPEQRFTSIGAFIAALKGEELEEPSRAAAPAKPAAEPAAKPAAEPAAKPAPAAAKPAAATAAKPAAATKPSPAVAKAAADLAARPTIKELPAPKEVPAPKEDSAPTITAALERTASGEHRGATAAEEARAARTVLGMGISAADVLKAASGETAAASPAAAHGAPSSPSTAAPAAGPVLLETRKKPDGQAVLVAPGVARIDPSTHAAETIVPSSSGVRQQPAAATGKRPPTGEGKSAAPPPAFSEADPLGSSSMNWFAEGVAAEQALAESRGKSGPLPAIYDGVDDEEELPRARFSASMIIVIVVLVAAVVIGLFLLSNREQPEHVPKPRVVAATADARPALRDTASASAEPDSAAAATTPPDAAAAVALPKVDAAPAKKLVLAPKPEPRKPEPRKPEPRKPEPPKRVEVKKPEKKPEPAKPSLKDAAQASLHVEQGRAHLRKGAYAKARSEFNRALSLSPSAAAHAGLGEVAFEEGFYSLAAKHLRTALRMQPNNTRYIVMLGHAYFKTNKLKEAITQYKKALQRSPNHAEARSGMQAAIRRLAGN